MKATANASAFLESLQRADLAMLLRCCQASLVELDSDNGFFVERVNKVVIDAPMPIDDALNRLPPQDRKRIAEAVSSSYPNRKTPDDIVVGQIEGTVGGAAALLAELIIHREMMIDVATGGSPIAEVNDYYRAREARILQTIPKNITYENPHTDLWDWYRYWRTELPQYKDRRSYIRQLFAPAINAVSQRPSYILDRREPTGWERVDRALAKARHNLETASAEEDFQAIGLICREIIISLAQAVYDPEIHETSDGVRPSATDANRMLEAYIAHVFPGPSYKEVRAHARASLALALNLQHRRTATQQLAALCVEAAASTTAVISIIARAGVGLSV